MFSFYCSHEWCQQVLREDWLRSDVTGKTIQWNSTNTTDQILYFISCCLLFPLHILLYPVTILLFKSELKTQSRHGCLNFLLEIGLHFTYPSNRFLSKGISFLLYLGLLMAYFATPLLGFGFKKETEQLAFDIVVIIFSGSYLLTSLIKFCKCFRKMSFHVW